MESGDKKVLDDVAKYGWHVTIIPEDTESPGFAYSVGIFKNYALPEVIVFGLPNERMHALVNLVGEKAKTKIKYSAGDVSPDFLEGFNCTFVEFPKESYHEFLGYDGFMAMPNFLVRSQTTLQNTHY